MFATSLLVMAIAPVTPAPAAPSAGGDEASTSPSPSGTLADSDGDGVTDDLARHLDQLSADEPVSVIATYHDRAGADAARQGLRAGELRRTFAVVPGFSATMPDARLRALARDPHLRRLERLGTSHVTMEAARADFGVELARERFGVTGAGVGVCIVDTGVDPGHEQFDTKLPIPFFDAINGRTMAYDDHGHGTHVASTAVGDGSGGSLATRLRGVAPDARLLAAKVLSSSGSGPNDGVVAGIEWCAQREDVHVISMSLGDPSLATDGQDAVSQAADAAVATYGKVVLAAAGNSGDAPGSINAPGSAHLVTAVGAVAEWSAADGLPWTSRGIYLAPFSSRGPTADGRTKPDVVAPGVTVSAASAGTTASYTTMSGTSMATPFVAGAAALVLGEASHLTASRVHLLLELAARDRGVAGKDDEWGAGLLDVHQLVNMVADVRDFDPGHLFPWEEHHEVTVPDGGRATIEITVPSDAVGGPLAVTAIADGAPACSWWFFGSCLAWEWSPDLDLELRDPGGTLVSTSQCPLSSDAECSTMGRQETLGMRPTVAGTYRLDVVPYASEPNYGKGGTVAITIMRGPLIHSDLPILFGADGEGAGPVYVADLTGNAERQGRVWSAGVEVQLGRGGAAWDGRGVVAGHWAHDGQVGWCVAADGRCRVDRGGLDASLASVTFVVDDVAATGDGALVAFDPEQAGHRASLTVER